MSEEYESKVERYFKVVESHLKERGLWDDLLRKFPPNAIRTAIAKILERLEEHYEDPETLDWGSLFEMMVDFETVKDFIRHLEKEKYIPPSLSEASRQAVDEIERQIYLLLEEAKHLDPSSLKRIRSQLAVMLGEANEIEKLARLVDSLRRKARREEKLRKEYEAKAAKLGEELLKLKREAEELRRRVEELSKARPPEARPEAVEKPPERPPEEKLEEEEIPSLEEVEAFKSVLGVKKYQGLPSLPSIEAEIEKIREKAPPRIKCPYCGGVAEKIGSLLLYRCSRCGKFINLR